MASPQPALRFPHDHVHPAGEICPTCEQPISNDKAQEIHARAKERERALQKEANDRAERRLALQKEQLEANAQATIAQVKQEAADSINKAAQELAARESAAKAAGKAEAEAAYKEKLTAAATREAAWQAKIRSAEQAKEAAFAQCDSLKAAQDDIVNAARLEVRAVMEKHEAEALAARDAKYFTDTRKLTTQLEDLKRQLEKKTADELGEGAEIDLLEALKAEFVGDIINRVGKGNTGPDITHVVMHNGRECGLIILDSKNSGAWRNDYVAKLLRDQTATKADHAVLCTLKMPAEAHQIALRDNVIVINPARAVALVHILRKHMVLVHTLRLSKAEREKKMAALYDFITSERCAHLLGRIDTHTDDLLELQKKEVTWHENQWKNEGALLRSIQKTKAELETEIECILGTHERQG